MRIPLKERFSRAGARVFRSSIARVGFYDLEFWPVGDARMAGGACTIGVADFNATMIASLLALMISLCKVK